MSTTPDKSKLVPFDAARYLIDDAAIVEYVNAVLEIGDIDLLLLALVDVARARGIEIFIAQHPCLAVTALERLPAGLGRESLYKALTSGAKSRFDMW